LFMLTDVAGTLNCTVVGICQRSEGEHRRPEEERKDESQD